MKSKANFRSTFFAGVVIILPISVSVWIIHFIFQQIHGAVTPWILHGLRLLGLGRWSEVAWVEYLAPLVSVALALLVIYLLGLVAGNVLGRQVLRWLDRMLMQVPLVRGIYSATRQFVDTFSSGNKAFQRVVLVQYPRPGVWTLGFITTDARGEVQARTHDRMVGVFVPTTPNPTSGFLLFVAEQELVPLTMSVDDAFKMVISVGVLTPPYAAAPAASVAAPGTVEG